ncbi:hypothetical protein [Carboxylicivirga marina]|uniref:hypothetical protein n=1 Tax=Carboxylicivirga marina TaxID=2800988 RepID=UPI00259AAD3C|nr:hypothetical protein [uncultured Carboxylicivirga sp.]
MANRFNPPIEKRKTSQLLRIVGNESEWNSEAVELASVELTKRKVSKDEIEKAKRLQKRKKKTITTQNAEKGYSIFDFIEEPFWTTFEVLFSWELKKDGFIRKARQQKYIRLAIVSIVIALYFLF